LRKITAHNMTLSSEQMTIVVVYICSWFQFYFLKFTFATLKGLHDLFFRITLKMVKKISEIKGT